MAAFATSAHASVASEEREGQQVLRAVESGDRKCADLSQANFERIGEYVMGRMAGSTGAHEQMNELMRNMMGKDSEEQMHTFMGRRFARCGGGQVPGSFGGMMGAMGMMGGTGMMGGRGPGGQTNGFGSMMGNGRAFDANDNDDDWSAAAIVMTVVMVALVVLLAALFLRRPSRGPGGRSALDILGERYARGEIDTDEYDARRRALGGA